ncbi:hypothetical protein BpHYR1_000353 [Brachionus plicatilis]|uniref:Uncharacterized protein n=1 Tax=Brachionus plicatilis TaxID=10195 RepID=A0A3M7SCJ0_BRAPC|nr:hypothetical protein BpHYR1_000353 [Brachionus plicatilis]
MPLAGISKSDLALENTYLLNDRNNKILIDNKSKNNLGPLSLTHRKICGEQRRSYALDEYRVSPVSAETD